MATSLERPETERGSAVPPSRRRPSRLIWTIAHVVGELLITFGILVLLFLFYELKVTDWFNSQKQDRLASQLHQQWGQPKPAGPTAPDPPLVVHEGQGFALLRIPRLGPDYQWVVVEGVNRDDLEEGPGHYPGTALPGQVGNMVISGHRTTYGHPFNQLDLLKDGDEVDIQVRSHTYRYHVIRSQVVDPSDVAVILPVPGHPGQQPTQRLLTMTTCNPKYSAAQRLIVTAELS